MIEIVKREKVVTVNEWEVNGKSFSSLEDAEGYVNKVVKSLKCKYFRVTHTPDDNEGRGYYHSDNICVLTKDSNLAYASVIEYYMKKFGKAVTKVMGVVPVPNFIIREVKISNFEELNSFHKEKVNDGIGDYRVLINVPMIYLNSVGEVQGEDSIPWDVLFD